MPISYIETASLDTALNAPTATALSTASGSAPSYSARAWVNFNGTGTVAIRASGNVSSITDNGTGDYTVNFTTAMLDANYESNVGASTPAVANGIGISPASAAPTTSALRIATVAVGGTPALTDYTYVNVVVFR